MNARIGDRVRTERELRGWTQQDLEVKSGVAFRTIQRVERGQVVPQLGTLTALAACFDVDVSRLVTGLRLEDLADLADECSCRTCGARLVERTFVDHDYGDCEYETFACGATRGWELRPCPQSREFPAFEDYELETFDDGEGTFACFARGLTEHARAVRLDHGHGSTPEEARRQVRWSYIAAQKGSDVADHEVGCRWGATSEQHGAPGATEP
jgi:transcriptional regulator with XRE-family HTH domain